MMTPERREEARQRLTQGRIVKLERRLKNLKAVRAVMIDSRLIVGLEAVESEIAGLELKLAGLREGVKSHA